MARRYDDWRDANYPEKQPAPTACGIPADECSASTTIGCDACIADASAGSELKAGDWSITADEALENERRDREGR